MCLRCWGRLSFQEIRSNFQEIRSSCQTCHVSACFNVGKHRQRVTVTLVLEWVEDVGYVQAVRRTHSLMRAYQG